MKPFIERTEDHLYTTWADINWRAVEEHGRRLQQIFPPKPKRYTSGK